MPRKILLWLAWAQEPLVGILWAGLAVLHPHPVIRLTLALLALSRFAKVIAVSRKRDEDLEHVGGGITSSVAAQEMHR